MYLNKFDLVIDLRVLEPHFFKWKDVRFLKNKLRNLFFLYVFKQVSFKQIFFVCI
jgi:hypothetical protein